MAGQRSAGTRPRARHIDGELCETGIAAANAATPPTSSIALCKGVIAASESFLTNVIVRANTIVKQVPVAITLVNAVPPEFRTLAERVAWRREQLGLTQADLALRAGVSQGTIGNIESGYRKQPRDLHAIADALRVTPAWLLGKPKALYNAGDYSPPITGEAAPINQSGAFRIISTPFIDWDRVGKMELPQEFRTALVDNSMAPNYRQGAELLFSTSEGEPRPMDIVLIKDRHGAVYCRQFQRRSADRWSAIATAPGYLPLDSQSDELTVLAIMVGSITLGRSG